MAPLVGRQRELGVLDAALDEASAGRTRMVLVRGDAGIGKTRLVEELVDRARRRGCDAVWGRAWEGGGAPEYWPWIEALRALGHDRALHEL
ncbi:MAG TPA: BREX system ATP-binding domain-containing protein, partial [Acidimicrobiales bacterium]|nr:BREX system ATP-binding domain-containing protein [Acidimicrobiales bacterium]